MVNHWQKRLNSEIAERFLGKSESQCFLKFACFYGAVVIVINHFEQASDVDAVVIPDNLRYGFRHVEFVCFEGVCRLNVWNGVERGLWIINKKIWLENIAGHLIFEFWIFVIEPTHVSLVRYVSRKQFSTVLVSSIGILSEIPILH